MKNGHASVCYLMRDVLIRNYWNNRLYKCLDKWFGMCCNNRQCNCLCKCFRRYYRNFPNNLLYRFRRKILHRCHNNCFRKCLYTHKYRCLRSRLCIVHGRCLHKCLCSFLCKRSHKLWVWTEVCFGWEEFWIVLINCRHCPSLIRLM